MGGWLGMGAAALGREIEAGRCDPRALAEAHLDAAANHPDCARVYARLTPGRARAEAAAAAERAQRGMRRGPLDGVPVTIKDLYDTAGVETEGGTRLLAGRRPERDAACVATLTAAGLVTLGKTHMTELAFSGLGVNPMTATAPNALNPAWAPGGSSSGAAASVALGLSPLALGSDTGGSIRGPAAWQSIVGLKPTFGLIPLEGALPLAADFDTAGPLARSVEDASLMFAALAARPPVELTGANLKGAAFVVPTDFGLDGADPEPVAAFEAALEALGQAGARIDRAPVPELGASLEATVRHGSPVAAQAYAQWRNLIEATPEKMHPPVLARFRGGAQFSAADEEAARAAFAALSRSLAARMAPYDALLMPTSPILPPDAGRLLADDAYLADRNLLALRNTRVGNFLGLIGLSLPTPAPGCGLLLNGLPGEEARLLRIGSAMEPVLAA
jgi:aspartyl-tRNA(Asn)/glutamyl-tRNA(Gln) amidotransferase subunit A